MWVSRDQGETWEMERQLTSESLLNHTFARRPIGVRPDFYATWADGHGREPSASRLYFCNRQGDVFQMPTQIEGDFAPAIRVENATVTTSR